MDNVKAVFGNEGSPEEKHSMHEFLKCLAICHSVVIDIDKEGVKTFQASSPDELALVQGAQMGGYEYI